LLLLLDGASTLHRRSNLKSTQIEPGRAPPPFPAKKLEGTGEEAQLEPRPRYHAPRYRGVNKLEGKVALITGGDSGIGRAVAVLYAREGADVAIVYLTHDADAEETRRAVEEEGRRCVLVKGDVGDPELCRRAVEETVSRLGHLEDPPDGLRRRSRAEQQDRRRLP
jgi:hypothetical protein